jgi:hypothetical protein
MLEPVTSRVSKRDADRAKWRRIFERIFIFIVLALATRRQRADNALYYRTISEYQVRKGKWAASGTTTTVASLKEDFKRRS